MARPLRLPIPGGIYHVTARGNDRRSIFEDDDDRASFLIVLAATVARHHVRCHAYCLMSNHYHLLLQTPEANLSTAMRQINGVYTQRFNRRRERCGHVLQGRFGAQLIDGDAYLQEVCRYIVLNPVRAGLVDHPGKWRWSSYLATVGEVTAPGFLSVDWVLSLAGARSRERARQQYRAFIESGIGEPETPLDSLRTKPAIGGETFETQLAEQWPPRTRSSEVPRAQRLIGRPTLNRLFEGVACRAQRNERAVVAVREHGYTMREVAEFLGRHYATISRVLASAERDHPLGRMSQFKT